ncbi:hypothetical protein [Virgibacillus proomii]|uniref:hypothetical protein n=1 Tax=Virgibacillus proomii TaxID=84407 RepID=UPI001C0F95B6|nr:hypothetical protein [Virgibacillus proomii]MBU5267808.1 hypothetical protein [Virgibacillus proomii]
MVIEQVDELEENILESFINYLLLSKFADPIRIKQYCSTSLYECVQNIIASSLIFYWLSNVFLQ